MKASVYADAVSQRRGRPRATWKRTVEAEIKEVGRSWREVEASVYAGAVSQNRIDPKEQPGREQSKLR